MPEHAALSGGDGGRKKPRSTVRGNRYRLDWAAADLQLARCEACGTMFRVWKHKPCGARIVVKVACDSRLCPRCSHRRAAALTAKYSGVVEGFVHPALFTLTVRNVYGASELPGALENLVKNFERLRRRKVWPEGARGIWAVEIVWTAERGYHVHLHCVMDLPFIRDLQDLAQVWTDLSGAKHQPDIKRAWSPERRAGLLHEGVKYVTKGWEVLWAGDGEGHAVDAEGEAPDRAIMAVLAGRRAVQAFGGLELPEEDSDGSSNLVCPRCGEEYHSKSWKSDWEMWDVTQAEVQAMRLGPLWHDVYPGWRSVV